MATHLGIIHKGKLLFQGSLSELQILKSKQAILQLETSNNVAAASLLSSYYSQIKNGQMLLTYESREDIARINRTLVENGVDVFLLQPQQNDLEQLFFDITSETI